MNTLLAFLAFVSSIDPIVFLYIVAAVIANMAIGFAWYLPQTFGTMWMHDAQVKRSEQPGKTMAVALVTGVLASAVTATILWYVNFMLGFAELHYFLVGIVLMWVAFVASIRLTHTMFEGKSFRYNLITSGHDLVSLLAMGAIVYFA